MSFTILKNLYYYVALPIITVLPFVLLYNLYCGNYTIVGIILLGSFVWRALYERFLVWSHYW